MRGVLALAVLALFVPDGFAGTSAPGIPTTVASQDESLEELLRRARREQGSVEERLRPRVERVRQGLEALKRPPQEALLEALLQEIETLGSPAAPLFLEQIDPGAAPTPGVAFRAEAVTLGLMRVDTSALTKGLLDLVGSASSIGRKHAIQLLGRAPASDAQARTSLLAMYDGDDPELRRAAARALALQEHPERGPFLDRALADAAPEVLGAVVKALAETPTPLATDAIVSLFSRPAAAQPWMASLLAILESGALAPLDEEQIDVLLNRATGSDLSKEERLALLKLLPNLEGDWTNAHQKLLRPLGRTGDADVREVALICLANLGDRGARRDLLRPYDELVSKNERWQAAFERRGRVLLAIGDGRAAARDFERAIELIQAQGRRAPSELQIELARAFVLHDKLRQAHGVLKDAGLSPTEIATLAADRDFEPLRAHARYGAFFVQ